VAVNCGAIPDNIVESELFGHVKGAFTGALSNKKGLIEEAEGGTLFLDELGELPHATQVKLLRFLENREIRPVGSSENIKVDVRIIAATNKDIQVAIAEKTFREDLFYRLNTFQLHLPPLRERSVTIPSLIRFFALKFTRELEKEITSIEPAAQVALSSYPYPGNVRELSNIIEHAIVLSEDGVIRIGDLPSDVSKLNEIKSLPVGHGVEGGELLFSEESPESLRSLGEVEKDHIILALKVMNNNQTDTAKKLGISRSTLWRKIQDHKIKLS
jgi:two-component system nitrogen regulation response regulator GlnG/two-component system response regulator HydG